MNLRKRGVANPFNTYNTEFTNLPAKPFETFSASAVSGKPAQNKREGISYGDPQSVALPPHLFMPEDAQSVNISSERLVAPGTQTILTFSGVPGSIVRFLSYAFYSTAPSPAFPSQIVPTVNGIRVFPYHGDPLDNYSINVSSGPDLSNGSMISCLLDLQPTDKLEWTYFNATGGNVNVGIRMVGYVDQSTIRKIGRFGG
jgi:hypothetical protein